MKWQAKSVLVTGAGGFIGSHLVERLVELGARVRALARYNSRNDWGLLELLPTPIKNEIEVVLGDITDPHSSIRVVQGQEIIFHLAALIAIPYSYIAPAHYVATNCCGTVNLLEASRHHGVERFVHTSTSETYGTAQYAPIDEAHPLRGQSPYAASKIGADKLAESYYLSFGSPGGHPAALQYLWAPAIGPGHHPHHHQPGSEWQRHSPGTADPDSRPDLRFGYRGGLH